MIYTVAAGPLRPLGYKEGIVTLMEFTRTHGCVIESGEFRHGPLEIVEPGVPFLFLLGNDESRHTTERAINFVKQRTGQRDRHRLRRNFARAAVAGTVPDVRANGWLCYYLSFTKITTRMNAAITVVWWNINPSPRPGNGPDLRKELPG